ncbi:hypothetical protein FRC04_011604 [Tulasnella sp. 424]|nr:hypothetical protein FRC04_011604 [Tulasnella sp. 424]
MKRSRQGQVSKPQSAQHAVTCKSDSKRLERDETSSDVGVGDVINRVQVLELSAELDNAAEGDTPCPLDLLPTEPVAAIFTEIVSSYVEPINRHKAPSRLLRISKRLHAIATANPRLWKTTVVSGRFQARHYAHTSLLDLSQNFLDSLIIRSSRPASASVSVNSWYLKTLVVKGVHLDWRNLWADNLKHLDVSFRQLNDAVWDSFAHFLSCNSRSLQHLSIRLERTVQGRPTNQPLEFGLLDTIRVTDWAGGIALPSFLGSLEVPRLRALEISGNAVEWTSWNLEEELKSVEDLRLHDLPRGEEVLVSLVSQLPRLRKFLYGRKESGLLKSNH